MVEPELLESSLRGIVEKVGSDRDLAGVIVRIERGDDTFGWTGAVGELEPDTPFFIASTTKLFTTAIVLRLAERDRLTLDDRLVDHVGEERSKGLHVYRGNDYTDQITIRHLLSHTSGLPDYFLGERQDGRSLEQTLRGGTDVQWTIEDVLDTTRQMDPAFPPGKQGKALYSDTNFQLLGYVIEVLEGVTYAEALRKEVFEPLRLENTWLYTDPSDFRPLPFWDGPEQMHIPRAMTSFGPDGGVVASVGDLMRFLRAFFGGDLFDQAVFPSLQVYNRIFFPLQYGTGFARFKLPRVFSPLVPPPEFLGHSGHSGAFAFHAPAEDVYLAGTVNNVARPGRAFRLMMRLLRAVGQH